ncbi:MAG TPA: pseudouridine synthase [Bacilli bacterium]
MRINKFISETGMCSRREADKLIAAGRVAVNETIAELGTKVSGGDTVYVDGKPLAPKKKLIYIALNKPPGITSTTELHIEGNIIDYVNHPERIFPIGRLDKDSEGLILLTNDGDIVNRILRAENRHEKEYIVTVDYPVTPDFIRTMADGVVIPDGQTLPCEVNQISERVFRIILTEGRNRQIRRMCAALDYQVRQLRRIRIMNIKIDGLARGAWRDLTSEELEELFSLLTYEPNHV